MTRKEFFEKVATELRMRGEHLDRFVPTADLVGDVPVYNLVADALGLKEPKTKIVYEWIYLGVGTWHVLSCLMTEDEAGSKYAEGTYKKTGRQWEVPE